MRGWRITDGDNQRLIEETVHYEDEDGERHVAEVKRYVHAGWRPDGAHTIWYDTPIQTARRRSGRVTGC